MDNISINSSNNQLKTATKFLNVTVAFWFLVAVLGQWIFAYYIAVAYGGSAIEGNLEKWDEVLYFGFIEGDWIGNFILVAHIFLAFVITVGGPIQLIPQLRNRALTFHRWNGRVYVLTAFLISLAGLYLVTVRGVIGGFYMQMGNTLNASLIMTFAALTLRTAMNRDFIAHRRWAIRMFLMVNGVWFFRIGFGLWIFLNGGTAPGSTESFQGPFDVFLAFGHSLIPLFCGELYFLAKEKESIVGRYLMAGFLIILAIGTGLGIFMAANIFWLDSF
jgi:hypothetical protein